jgi:hypothetical protein
MSTTADPRRAITEFARLGFTLRNKILDAFDG